MRNDSSVHKTDMFLLNDNFLTAQEIHRFIIFLYNAGR